MARSYRRKYARRRRPRRYKRRMRRMSKRRGRRSWGRKIYTYRRTKVDTINFSGGVPAGGYTFQLSDVPNYTEFTTLYDQYKISKVVVKIVPRFNSVDTTQTRATIYSIVDYTDVSAITSANLAMEYGTVKRHEDNRTITRIFRPKFSVPAYTGSVTFGYASRMGWLQIADYDVKHYGLKLFWEGHGLVSREYDVYRTFYVKFKNTK